MERYSSIDFLRGLAIFLMVVVHTLMRWVWRDPIMSDMGQYSLFVIILLLAALFLGGWCGLFLMVSATGNMISMQKSLERNSRVESTVSKQIIGGFLLLFCAVLTEALTGYNGYLGRAVTNRAGDWARILNGGFHFETIHAVAWCIILNGVTQGILSINGGWKKINRNITIYIILALFVVAATPFVWKLADFILPGYPFESRHVVYDSIFGPVDTNNSIQYGYLGYDSIWRLTLLFFLDPLAGSVEPIFPFLAISYIGSIFGLLLLRKQKEMDGFNEYEVSPMKNKLWLKKVFQIILITSIIACISFGVLWQIDSSGNSFLYMQLMGLSLLIVFLSLITVYYFRRKERELIEYKRHTLPVKIGMMIGFTLFMVGLIGVFLIVFFGPDGSAIDNLLGYTYDVRAIERTGIGLSLFWFSVVTGAQIGAVSLLLRVTEFRGKTRAFGKKTLWFRRFGMVPFSIYNYQFIDVLPVLLLSAIGPFIPIMDQRLGFNYSLNGMLFPGFTMNSYGVYGIGFLLGLIILMYWLLLWLWQKAHFAFGFEWFLAKASNILIPSKRKDAKARGRQPFWKAERLNVENALVNPEWLDVIKEEHIPREQLVDSKLSWKLGIMGILIAPISLISLGISITARKKEGINKYNTIGLILSIFGAVLAVGIIFGTMFIFGISF